MNTLKRSGGNHLTHSFVVESFVELQSKKDIQDLVIVFYYAFKALEKKESTSQERKKKNANKLASIHTLSVDDIEQIVTQVTISTEEIFDKVKSNQKESYEKVTK